MLTTNIPDEVGMFKLAEEGGVLESEGEEECAGEIAQLSLRLTND